MSDVGDDDLTPWDQQKRLEELEEELRDRGSSPFDAVWDDGGGQIVEPTGSSYPPPYDLGPYDLGPYDLGPYDLGPYDLGPIVDRGESDSDESSN